MYMQTKQWHIMKWYQYWHNAASYMKYRQVSNTRHTLASNKIVDHSDVAGASPVGAAPTTSSFST